MLVVLITVYTADFENMFLVDAVAVPDFAGSLAKPFEGLHKEKLPCCFNILPREPMSSDALNVFLGTRLQGVDIVDNPVYRVRIAERRRQHHTVGL